MRRIPLSIEVRKVLKLLIYTLFGMLIVLSAYFFIKTSYSTEKGYALREGQMLQKNLEAENRILKQRVLDAQSLNELKNSDAVQDMTEPAAPTYVAPKRSPSQQK